MSLINDALKKAQHQRTGGTDLPPMPGGSGPIRTTKSGSSSQGANLPLLIGGGVGVAVLAVGLTLFFVNRKPESGPAPHPVAVAKPAAETPTPVAAVTPPPSSTPAPIPAAPVVVAPVSPPAASSPPVVTAAKPTPAPVVSVPSVTATPPKLDLSSQKLPAADAAAVAAVENHPAPAATTPVTTAPAPAAESPRVLPGGQDLRILQFVDTIRVMGIRSSGTDSKVLMNEKVYRVNDMVDYTLGIRLTKVSADGLTFTDLNGTTYVKNF